MDRALERVENTSSDSLVVAQIALLRASLDRMSALVQTDLTRRDRTKLVTLITVSVHARDVVQNLLDTKVDSVLSFHWQSQLRSYIMDTAKPCELKIADAVFKYGYEYVGNCGRLVITPLTDRCYLTLTQVGPKSCQSLIE